MQNRQRPRLRPRQRANAAPAAQAPAAPDAALPAIPPDQQPTNEQLAKLFEAMRLREQLASVTKMMPNIMQQAMEEQLKQVAKDHPEVTSMTDAQKQAAQEIVKNYMQKVIGVYSPDDMIADMASVYKKNLTRTDVDGIIAFYQSPVGQHMLDRMPAMMKDSMNLVMESFARADQAVLDVFTSQMEDLAKQSAPAAAQPAAEKPAAK